MPPRLEWRKSARIDLIEIISFIADDNPDAAQALKDEIESKVALLPENPKLYHLPDGPFARIAMVFG